MVDSIPFYKHHLVEPVLNQRKVVCYMFCSVGLIDPKDLHLALPEENLMTATVLKLNHDWAHELQYLFSSNTIRNMSILFKTNVKEPGQNASANCCAFSGISDTISFSLSVEQCVQLRIK
jgi:hypothetical protein